MITAHTRSATTNPAAAFCSPRPKPEVEETATRRRTSVRLKAPMRIPTDTTTATVSG